MAKVTFSSSTHSRHHQGGSIHDSPLPGVQFGDPTKLSPVGFLLQSISFTLVKS